MKCPYCTSFNAINKGIRNSKQRYKCNACEKWFSENTNSFYYRHRFPPFIMLFCIMLCIVVQASLVSLFAKLIFRCYVSPKTIRKWTRKFLATLPNAYQPVKQCDKVFLICHADEKFIKIRGKQAYDWNLVDCAGNWITSLVTPNRDKESAKRLYKQLKQIYKKVDIIVTDGCKSYIGLESLFGLSCTHVIAGLKEKLFWHKKICMFTSNNYAENIHSHIEMYLARFRHHFTTLESAQAYIRGFMFVTYLLRSFQLQHSLQQSSIPDNRGDMLREVQLLMK